MYFVVLPAETLGDPDPSPLLLGQQPQGTTIVGIEELLWDQLKKWLGQDDMAIFIMVV
jgi:hypothetical protein